MRAHRPPNLGDVVKPPAFSKRRPVSICGNTHSLARMLRVDAAVRHHEALTSAKSGHSGRCTRFYFRTLPNCLAACETISSRDCGCGSVLDVRPDDKRSVNGGRQFFHSLWECGRSN